MWGKLLLVVVFLRFFETTYAQGEFVGALIVPKNQIITYKISFEIKDDNTIEGLSTTDFLGENKTISKISGTFSADSILSFHETANLSTISNSDNASFCYVFVNSITLKVINEKTLLQGDFIGKYSNGNNCAEGKINLISTNIIKELQTLIDSSKIGSDTTEKITSFLNAVTTPIENIKTIHSNEELVIEWEKDSIEFDVWDGYLEDNDVISIYQDGKLIESFYTISNNKKTFKLPFYSDTSLIEIIAINEGGTVSNTVNYNFKDKITQTPIISSLKKEESIFIRVTRK